MMKSDSENHGRQRAVLLLASNTQRTQLSAFRLAFIVKCSLPDKALIVVSTTNRLKLHGAQRYRPRATWNDLDLDYWSICAVSLLVEKDASDLNSTTVCVQCVQDASRRRIPAQVRQQFRTAVGENSILLCSRGLHRGSTRQLKHLVKGHGYTGESGNRGSQYDVQIQE